MKRLHFIFALLFGIFANSECYKKFDYCEGTTDWIKFNDNCYFFKGPKERRVSYYDAEDFCRSQGAHLASVHSEEENNFLLKTAEEGGFGGRLWIGLNTLQGENSPQWSDGSDVNFSKRVRKEFYVNERCFILFRSQGGWRPEHCALHYIPICKKAEGAVPTHIPPFTPPPPLQGGCPKDWIQFDQKCYKLFGREESDRKDFKRARDACWSLGDNYSLVSIHSRAEQAFLSQHLEDLGTSAWIGFRYIESDEIGHDMVFGWVDNSRTDVTFWDRGNPPPGTWKYCARLDNEGVTKGQWVADYCEIGKRGYICQTPTDPNLPVPTPEPSNCPAEFSPFRKSCYKYMLDPKNWEEAEKTCVDLGGHLASVVDGYEQNFLINFVNDQPEPLWSGLHTEEGSRYLRWSDKQPVYFTNWFGPGITDMNGKKSCTSFGVEGEMIWAARPCLDEIPFICKISNEQPPVFPETTGSCPTTETEWIDIGDEYCYHVGSVMSWDTTARYCFTKGMKMIYGYSDHQFSSLVAQLWKSSYVVHLGLLRTFDKDSFIWSDGSPLNYTNWDEKEPTPSSSAKKDCVAFEQTTGKWRTISCYDAGLAMCQAPKLTT